MKKSQVLPLLIAMNLNALLLTSQIVLAGQASGQLNSEITKRLNEPRLLSRGQTRVYSGEHLMAISLPVGGIGTGCIQINGKAERAIWQIFNNYTQAFVPHSFFAVRTKARDGQPIVRVLQTSNVGPFEAMKSLDFRGEFPFGWYDFEDDELPVKVSMETFNPLIPLNAKDSAIPCAIFNLTAKNTSDKPVEVSFLAAQQNAVGFTGEGQIDGHRFSGYGGNRNRLLKRKGATILHMTSDINKNTSGYGDMALMVFEDNANATASWGTMEGLKKDWAEDGILLGELIAGPSPAGQSIDGALNVTFTLKPNEKHTVCFALTWHFPNVRHGTDEGTKYRNFYGDKPWYHQGNMYTNFFSDAMGVACCLKENIDDLTRLTRLYHDTFYTSNLPYWLLDRISSQAAILKSKTCFWAKNGYFGGWEGCNYNAGSCFGNSSHVWQYAQLHSRLFPSIARRMREASFQYQSSEGGFPFRQPGGIVAIDGQFGEILEAYREHLTSADQTWLNKHWTPINNAMQYAIEEWDRDEDGVLAGDQWNTLDCNVSGNTSWLGAMYLASLGASEKMAKIQGDTDSAQRYRRILESGAKKQNQALWNGEYYIQIPDLNKCRDYNTGCHIDQVLGQWWAKQLDLGWLYPPKRVHTAMQSLFKYNFRTNFHGFEHKYRKFVDDNDAGTLMITWPKGGRPANSTHYADEVWTGTEYPAAAMMVYSGMLTEALVVMLSVYDRHDGRLRTGLSDIGWKGVGGNPFCDVEAGRFYTRAMSVWSVLLACQGFIYDGPAAKIGFKPVWKPKDHVSFFTAAQGWGLFSQKRYSNRQTSRIDIAHGSLRVSQMIFELPTEIKPARVCIEAAGKAIKSQFNYDNTLLTIRLAKSIAINAGQSLNVIIEIAHD